MWSSENIISFNSATTPDVGRTNISLNLSSLFSNGVVNQEDYKLRFLRATAGSFANVPDLNEVLDRSEDGFNVGQIQPYDPFTNEYVFADKEELSIDPDPTIARLLKRSESYQRQLLQLKPGANRINLIFNIQENLNTLLQQNLLMPSDIDHDDGFTTNQQLDLIKN